MPVSPFTYVPEQKVLNTYTPLPYDDILKAGLSQQQQYNTGEAAASEIDNFFKVPSLNQDTSRRDEKIKNYKNELVAQVEKAGGDYSKVLPFVKEQAKRIKEDLNYGEFGAIKASHDAYIDYVGKLDKAREKGEINQSDYDYLQKRSLSEYKGIGNKTDAGNFNRFKDLGYAKNIDLPKIAMERANDWKETQLKSGNWIMDADGQYKSKVTGRGVDFNEVYNEIYKSLENTPGVSDYLSQEYGKSTWSPNSQSLDQSKSIYIDPITGQRSSINPEQYQDYFFNERIGQAAKAGAEKESHLLLDEKSRRNLGYMNPLQKAKLKAVQDEANIGLQTVVPEIKTNLNNNPFNGTPLAPYGNESLEFTKNGAPIFRTNGTAKWSGIIEPFQRPDGTYYVADNQGLNGIDVKKTNEFLSVINKYTKDNPVMKGMTPQEVAGAISQGNQNRTAYTTPEFNVTGFDPKKIAKNIGNLIRSNSVELSIDGDDTPMTNSQIFEKLNISKDKLDKTLDNLNVSTLNPYKGGYVVTIPNSDGTPVKIVVSGIKEMDKKFTLQKQIAEAEKNGDTSPKIAVNDDGVFVSQTKLTPSNNGWRYATAVYQVTGELSTKERSSLSESKKKELIANKILIDLGNGRLGTLEQYNYDPSQESERQAKNFVSSNSNKPFTLKEERKYLSNYESDEISDGTE